MSYDFKFGGLWLSEFGGFTQSKPNIDVAQYDGTLSDTPGKNGADFTDNHRYKNVKFTREVTFNAQKNMRISDLPTRLIEWLGYLKGYQEYEDTLREGLVTEAVLENFPEVLSEYNDRINSATLKFSRKPFWYRKDSMTYQNIDLSLASVDYVNPFPVTAEPLLYFRIKLAETDPVTIKYTLTNGGVTTEYTMAAIPANVKNIYVDCEKKEVRSVVGAATQYFDFAFPDSFGVGETTLAITAGKDKLQELLIRPRWRCL